jgi:hypothetical protein
MTAETETYESFGYALAMGVLQSDLYRHLDDRQRAECDELIARGQGRASIAVPPESERVALPEQPTGDEYHAANRCVDAAVLHLTGSTEWPDGWMALRDQFLGFIRDALLAHARLRPAAGGGAVATVDPEDLILKCVPGGDSCDPQGVADAIREYFAATAQAGDATNAADGVDTSRVDQPKGGA